MASSPKPVERVSAAFDEASFVVLTGLMQVQRKVNHSSDPAGLAKLLDMASWPREQVFVKPPVPTEVVQTLHGLKMRLALAGVQGAGAYTFEQLSFPSSLPSGDPNNDTVRLHMAYRDNRRDLPTLIYLHGWMAYDPALWMRAALSWAIGLEINLAFMELPFHMSRAPLGTKSGENSITSDLPATVACGLQGVSDVRAALYWLRSQGVPKVALSGKSLGGALGGLCVAAEPDFDAAVLLVPAIDTVASLWQSGYTRLIRASLLAQGIDEEASRKYLAALDPFNFQPAMPRQDILIIGASADRVCPPSRTARFADTWGVELTQVPFGHFTCEFVGQLKQRLQAFLKPRISSQ